MKRVPTYRLLKNLPLVGLVLTAVSGAAQTDCPEPPVKTDYTHTYEQIPGKCVHFCVEDSTVFLYTGKGKLIPFRMLPGGGFQAALATVQQNNSAGKLSPEDVLFLVNAYTVWDTKRMTIGFTFTTTGLGYKITEQGSGKLPEVGKKVFVHYRGYLEDGTEFDNSFKRNDPIAFELGTGRVIKGWDEGIQLFPVGSKGTLRIPPDLGYGARGAGGVIPPNATLFFDIEVVNAD